MSISSHFNEQRQSGKIQLHRSFASMIEALEERVLFNTFTVTNTDDSGPGSLRQAILDANASTVITSPRVIAFDIAGSGVHTITPASPLPAVAQSMRIDGSTQPGYSAAVGAPLIEISGANAGATSPGLVLTAANAGINALTINRFSGDGVVMAGAEDRITACYIGTDASGSTSAANRGNGVVVEALNEQVGGAGTARNVISGNGLAGISVLGNSQLVLWGNYIGTNAAGTAAVGNSQEGILSQGAISTNVQSDRNVISGNGASGILMLGTAANLSLSVSYVGLNAAGTGALGNGADPGAAYRDGITLLGGMPTIGQTGSRPGFGGLGNVISGNFGAGINIGPGTAHAQIVGNLIGTDGTGTVAVGNHGNGIQLGGLGAMVGINGTPPTTTTTLPMTGGNIIAGNGGDGIVLLTSANQIEHDYIGVNVAGAPLGNAGHGIEIRGGSNTIGIPFEGNVISANGGAGISVQSAAATSGQSNNIQANLIGSNPAGTGPMGNGGNGIEVIGGTASIGGTATSQGNLIVANGGDGVLLSTTVLEQQQTSHIVGNSIGAGFIPNRDQSPFVQLGNMRDGITVFRSSNNQIIANTIGGNGHNGISIIGFAPDPQNISTGNRISRDNFVSNAGLDIDLGDDGPTPNDRGDLDNGPNRLQNFPVLQSAAPLGTQTLAKFQLDTQPGTYTIDFYASSVPNPPSPVPGKWAVVATVTVVNSPTAVYTATLPALPVGTLLWATATDAQGDTSELSQPVVVAAVPPTVLASHFIYGNPNTVTVQFDQDVSAGLAGTSLLLHDLDTGQDLTSTSVRYDSSTNTATFLLPDTLPDGRYVATLPAASVANAAGQHLLVSGGGDYQFSFSWLRGDANHDGVVDLNDLLLVSRAYDTTGLFIFGDLNFDGKINFQDLLIIAQNYGHRLPT